MLLLVLDNSLLNSKATKIIIFSSAYIYTNSPNNREESLFFIGEIEKICHLKYNFFPGLSIELKSGKAYRVFYDNIERSVFIFSIISFFYGLLAFIFLPKAGDYRNISLKSILLRGSNYLRLSISYLIVKRKIAMKQLRQTHSSEAMIAIRNIYQNFIRENVDDLATNKLTLNNNSRKCLTIINLRKNKIYF